MDALLPRIVVTQDGSHSLYAPQFNQHYHSLHGSLQESLHIFIDLGLRPFLSDSPGAAPVRIFEMGLGTGLNALLTWQLADQTSTPVYYEAIEAFPVGEDQVSRLNYEALTGQSGLKQIHRAAWAQPVRLSPCFEITKHHRTLQDYAPRPERFDLVYYDAFSPEAQPELWTEALFGKVATFLRPGGSLVTYCTKGDVKRALRAVGFRVEKHPGPRGKREVLRAIRE